VKVPHWKELQRLGYLIDYADQDKPTRDAYQRIKADSAVDHQKHKDSGSKGWCGCAWCSLTRLDRWQARRNYVDDHRTSSYANPDNIADNSQSSRAMALDGLGLANTLTGHKVRQIAGWYIDGHNQVDIAKLLGCSQSAVSQLVSKYIKPLMAVYAPARPPGSRFEWPEYDMRHDYTGLYDRHQMPKAYKRLDLLTGEVIETVSVQSGQTHEPRQMGPNGIYRGPHEENMRGKRQ